MKKLIRLTESDLHRIVKETINRIIKEVTNPINGKRIKGLKKIYGSYAKPYYYKQITSSLIEIYDENGKYLCDVKNLQEFCDIFKRFG